MDELRDKVQQIFRRIFHDKSLTIRDNMSAADVPLWDSLAHINLIIAVESEFRIKFATAEISKLKEPGQDVGQFLQLLEQKIFKKTPPSP
jgi:acyl carrier protein